MRDFTFGGHRVNRTLPGVRTKREALLTEARLRSEYKGRLNRGGTLTTMTVETTIQRYVTERLKPKSKPAALSTYLTVPYAIHTVLTDNAIQFTNRARDVWDGQHISDRVCDEHEIKHRLTKVNHPWTNGQVERMNRALKSLPPA